MTNQIKPIVEVINNKAITYSTNIAEVFNKSHDDLFRKISKLEKDVRKNAEMFERCEYIDSYDRKQPCYRLNRDGAVLLIMGFTGKKALEFKLKYIEAFNMMEAKLKELSNKSDFETALTTVKQHTRKLPTVRVKKEITFPEDAYKRLGGVINRCIDARFDRIERFIREPELKFTPTSASQDTNLTAFDKKELFNDKKRDELMKKAKMKLLSMIDEFCQFQNQIAEVTGAIKYNIYLKKNYKKAK